MTASPFCSFVFFRHVVSDASLAIQIEAEDMAEARFPRPDQKKLGAVSKTIFWSKFWTVGSRATASVLILDESIVPNWVLRKRLLIYGAPETPKQPHKHVKPHRANLTREPSHWRGPPFLIYLSLVFVFNLFSRLCCFQHRHHPLTNNFFGRR